MKNMEAPAAAALDGFTATNTTRKPSRPRRPRPSRPALQAMIPMEDFATAIKAIAPKLELPPAEEIKGRRFRSRFNTIRPA